MSNRKNILADIIEPHLGDNGDREQAEELAQECLDIIALNDPIKWEVGGKGDDGEFFWFRIQFEWADDEAGALALAKKHTSENFTDLRVRRYER